MTDKSSPPDIIMTRPRAASERFLAALGAKRLAIGRVVISPAISIEQFEAPVDLDGFSGVIVTSSNALAGVSAGPGLTAWCVGDATAEAAARAGFEAVSTGGSADDLLGVVSRAQPRGPLLYLRGRHVNTDLAERLAAEGVDVAERVVYDQPERAPTDEARALLAETNPLILPLFSPRTARIVAGWVAAAAAPTVAVVMSGAVAEAWGGEARVAARPTVEAMVGAVAELIAETGNG